MSKSTHHQTLPCKPACLPIQLIPNNKCEENDSRSLLLIPYVAGDSQTFNSQAQADTRTQNKHWLITQILLRGD